MILNSSCQWNYVKLLLCSVSWQHNKLVQPSEHEVWENPTYTNICFDQCIRYISKLEVSLGTNWLLDVILRVPLKNVRFYKLWWRVLVVHKNPMEMSKAIELFFSQVQYQQKMNKSVSNLIMAVVEQNEVIFIKQYFELLYLFTKGGSPHCAWSHAVLLPCTVYSIPYTMSGESSQSSHSCAADYTGLCSYQIVKWSESMILY